MTRLYLPHPLTSGKTIEVFGEKARYLHIVLRCRPGEEIVVFNHLGRSYRTRVISVSKKSALLEPLLEQNTIPESPLKITLLQSILKGSKMDLVVQKTTELGVHKIMPFVSERSDVLQTRKLVRWEKIAEEAARQSGRVHVPAISGPLGFEDAVRAADNAAPLKLQFWEEGGEQLKEVLGSCTSCREAAIICGPEGGFTLKEVQFCQSFGFRTVSLGRRILRAETASIASLSILQYTLGDMGSAVQ